MTDFIIFVISWPFITLNDIIFFIAGWIGWFVKWMFALSLWVSTATAVFYGAGAMVEWFFEQWYTAKEKAKVRADMFRHDQEEKRRKEEKRVDV